MLIDEGILSRLERMADALIIINKNLELLNSLTYFSLERGLEAQEQKKLEALLGSFRAEGMKECYLDGPEQKGGAGA